MSEMKATFKFEIGDMVTMATNLAAAETATVLGKEPIYMCPYQIAERNLQECHGGVNQVHYKLVGGNGLIAELGLVPYAQYTAELDKARCLQRDRFDTMQDQINMVLASVKMLKANKWPTDGRPMADTDREHDDPDQASE